MNVMLGEPFIARAARMLLCAEALAVWLFLGKFAWQLRDNDKNSFA
jgi:hypothetical protein